MWVFCSSLCVVVWWCLLFQVREREVANPRFSFLDPKDIYYKYYRSLVPTAVRPPSLLIPHPKHLLFSLSSSLFDIDRGALVGLCIA